MQSLAKKHEMEILSPAQKSISNAKKQGHLPNKTSFYVIYNNLQIYALTYLLKFVNTWQQF